MKLSWQQEMRDRIKSLQDENLRLNQQIAMLSKQVSILEPIVKGPPTMMIACERIVDAAAHLVGDARQMLLIRR